MSCCHHDCHQGRRCEAREQLVSTAGALFAYLVILLATIGAAGVMALLMETK
jgi:hypothetical protein